MRAHPGIRAVRPLARDEHRESWLVRLEGHDDARSAVLVRPLGPFGAQRVRAELVALHRARGDGIVPLLDVLDEEHGLGLLRGHVAGPRLASVLAVRQSWEAGEVVTALKPLVDALARLHRNGVAHGALNAAAPVIDEQGTVLVELAQAELFAEGASEAVLARVGGVAADRESLRTLATELLRRVDGSRARAARHLADDTEHCPGAELAIMLRAGLDDLAAAVPVRPRGSEPSAAPDIGVERMLPVVRDEPVTEPEVRAHGPSWRHKLDGIVGGLGEGVGALKGRLDALPALRRRALVAGGAALCAAAVLLALPGGGAEEPSAAHVREPRAGADVDPNPTSAPLGVTEAAIQSDDPLAAATALLKRRRGCFTELSLLCLEEVDQQGSAALARDREAMLALRSGGEARYPDTEPTTPRLVERLGDGALLELGPETAPASLLLMRSEAGWRIRDWVAVGGN